jgi:hypothetical protein
MTSFIAHITTMDFDPDNHIVKLCTQSMDMKGKVNLKKQATFSPSMERSGYFGDMMPVVPVIPCHFLWDLKV